MISARVFDIKSQVFNVLVKALPGLSGISSSSQFVGGYRM